MSSKYTKITTEVFYFLQHQTNFAKKYLFQTNPQPKDYKGKYIQVTENGSFMITEKPESNIGNLRSLKNWFEKNYKPDTTIRIINPFLNNIEETIYDVIGFDSELQCVFVDDKSNINSLVELNFDNIKKEYPNIDKNQIMCILKNIRLIANKQK